MTGKEHAKMCDEQYNTNFASMTDVEALWDLFCVATDGIDDGWVGAEIHNCGPSVGPNACCGRAGTSADESCIGCPLAAYGYRCMDDGSPWRLANMQLTICIASGHGVGAYVDAKILDILVVYLIYLSEGGEDTS